LAGVDAVHQPDLSRCAGLVAAGVPVAASSAAPYASPGPWHGMAAAMRRETRGGRELGRDEAVTPATALALYLGAPEDPGGPSRRIEPGAMADLCLLAAPLGDALRSPSAELVRMTLVGGRVAYDS